MEWQAVASPSATHREPETISFQSGTVRLSALSLGEGAPILLYHGFPDTAYSFIPVMRRLAAAGYRAVAPFLRGYAPSDLDPDGDYGMLRLGEDIVACIDALDAPDAAVVGHDWGAVAAYMAAMQHPERLHTLITAAVPHPRRFLLSPTRRQLHRSRYMLAFQLPGAAERFARDGALERLVAEWSPGWNFADSDLRPVKQLLRDPERVAAMLDYYRQMARSLLRPALVREALQPVTLPVTMIAGADDGCIGLEMFSGQTELFPSGLDLHVLTDTGHFMHCEQPDVFAKLVLRALDSAPAD